MPRKTVKVDMGEFSVKEDLLNVQYVPLRSIEKAMEFLETPQKSVMLCNHNLQKIQSIASVGKRTSGNHRWSSLYQEALCNAIYSHDWNKLKYLLKKLPIWDHKYTGRKGHKSCWFFTAPYIRAYTILMMNHPVARSQDLLNNYLEMVLSCRTEQEKKAVMKSILHLPNQLVRFRWNEQLFTGGDY